MKDGETEQPNSANEVAVIKSEWHTKKVHWARKEKI